MAIRPKNQVGTMDCLVCGHEIPVKEGESGTLSFSCPWCDFPGYAKAGTQALGLVKARLKPMAAAIAKAYPNPPADQPPAPALTAPKKKTLFG